MSTAPPASDGSTVPQMVPQPGDAERLAQIRADNKSLIAPEHWPAVNRNSDVAFLLVQLDAAHSALAEGLSRYVRQGSKLAEVEVALAASRVEVARLKKALVEAHKLRHQQLTERAHEAATAADELAYLRSPAATMEDREAARAFLKSVGVNCHYSCQPACADCYNKSPGFEQKIATALQYHAAARVEGVREGMETCDRLIAALQDRIRDSRSARNWCVVEVEFSTAIEALAFHDALGALAAQAPEPPLDTRSSNLAAVSGEASVPSDQHVEENAPPLHCPPPKPAPPYLKELQRIADALESLDRWHRETPITDEPYTAGSNSSDKPAPLSSDELTALGYIIEPYTIGLDAKYENGVLTGRSLYYARVRYGGKTIYNGDDRGWYEFVVDHAQRKGRR